MTQGLHYYISVELMLITCNNLSITFAVVNFTIQRVGAVVGDAAAPVCMSMGKVLENTGNFY